MKKQLKQRRYKVTLNRKEIDIITHVGTEKNRAEREDNVKRGLVNHDGYDPDIKVREIH